MRKVGTALVLVASFAQPTAGRAIADTCGATDLRTLKVEVESAERTYERGESALLVVDVTRTPDGYNPPGWGASGVQVVVSLSAGPRVLGGGGETDVAGRALVPIRIPAGFPARRVDVSVEARREHVDAACVRAREIGYAWEMGLFRVKP